MRTLSLRLVGGRTSALVLATMGPALPLVFPSASPAVLDSARKYLAIVVPFLPAAFLGTYPELGALNVMRLGTPSSAIVSAVPPKTDTVTAYGSPTPVARTAVGNSSAFTTALIEV